MRKSSIVPILIILLVLVANPAKSQCGKNLEDARRAYYNGDFRSVESLLEDCLETFSDEEKIEAYKLLTNMYLLWNNQEKADQSMFRFLELNPYYTLRESDLVEFQELHKEYKVKTRFTYGFSVGYLHSDYIIMQHQSLAGTTEEPADYKEFPGIIVGVTGDYRLYKDFYANVGLLYSRRSMRQQEEILEYQKVASFEKDHFLNIPLQIRYIADFRTIKPFLGGGYGAHILLQSQGDIDRIPLEPDFPSIVGIAEQTTDYNLTKQRRKLTHNWNASTGVIIDFNQFLVELKATYQLGINNEINRNYWLKNTELTEVYAFVSDDYRIDSYLFTISLLRNISNPIKN